MKNLTLSLICLALSITSSFAQNTPVEVPGSYSSGIRGSIAFNGKLFFSVDNQLWATDGTIQGTTQVKAWPGISPGLYSFKVFNSNLYFIVNDGVHGNELWKSDGTTSGTNLVKDINPYDLKSAFLNNPYPHATLLQELNGKLYFVADDSVHGRELWMSDGTDAGTQMVKDIFTVADSNGIPDLVAQVEDFLVAGNKIYFPANDGSGIGIELWATDGTSAGTQLVKDIVPGPFSSDPRYLIPFQDKVVFTIDNNTISSVSVVISDGTASGTFDLATGFQNSRDHVVMNNKLYFCDTEPNHKWLVETDGTAQNTNAISELQFMALTDMGKGTVGLTAYNNKLYFRSGLDAELWQSDGTAAGTMLLKNISTGASSSPYVFTEFGNKLYFRARDTFMNLYYTDGTAAGTQLVSMPGANYIFTILTQIYVFGSQPLVPVGTNLFYSNRYDSTAGTRIYRLGMFPDKINQVSEVSAIDIYPNPSQGYINIDAENAVNISIHDISGRLVYNKQIGTNEKTHKADVYSLSPGTYTTTTLFKDGTKLSGKFVKQ